jgi:hypothetical protein
MGYMRVLRIIVLVVILILPAIPVYAQDGEGLPVCPEGFVYVPSGYVGEGQCVEIADSVGGVLGTECQLYLTPDIPISVYLYAGYDLRVTGINLEGTFYQVIPFEGVPIRFWMPVSCIAPNPDQYWFERPLPITVVS